MTAIFLALSGFHFGFSAQAADHVSTITQLQGETQLYSNPSKSPIVAKSKTAGTVVLFENEYFLVQEAKIGDKVKNGNILRTRPGAHANVIFENGDQIHIGPGSSYRVQWNDKLDDKLKVNLMYGRLRGIISKEGPRQKAIIKTRSATMGVRGTDFFIADSGPNGETEISVLRGEVEVTSESTKKILPVKTGMSATITTKTEMEVRETTKEDLNGIQIASSVTAPAMVQTKSAEKQKITELEKKALAVTLHDIKTYQPEVYEKISADAKIVSSVQELNSKAYSITVVNAPSAPSKRGKPRITELKDSDDQEVYQKYFKLKQ